jgi:arabinan endo-1,5-alpha-L-arabinosidase
MSSSHVVCGIIQGIKRIGCLVGAPHAQQKGWRASPRVGPALRPLWLGIAVATLNAWAQTSTPPVLPKVEPEPDRLVQLASRGIRAHDPSTIVKCGDEYWLFATGNGIISWRSKDLLTWAAGPRVFTNPPAWTTNMVPGNRGYFWAPDVIHVRNLYLLYYSVSTWGKNTSAIGLATNPTLDPAATTYAWTDAGLVIASKPEDHFNAIDPAVTLDGSGNLWLAFGSFWSGIMLVQLDPTTGRRLAPDSPLYSLASNEQIEAACIYPHRGHYYLFVNWGACCRGTNSTYNIRVGRSDRITGPYLDRNGADLLAGGGGLLLGSSGNFIGPGHAGIVSRDGADWLSCHFYDGTRGGMPTLALLPLRWDTNGWPEVVVESK